MSIKAVKNLADIKVIKTSVNWHIFFANFDDSSSEGGQLCGPHRPLSSPSLAASQPNAWHGREHGQAPLEVISGLGVTALRKSEGRQCKEPFNSFLQLAPSQLQMAQRCPFQMWTNTVAVQGS